MLFLLLGCVEPVSVEVPVCDVTLVSASPSSALPGELVTLTANPLTEDYDTAILVGGVRAEIGDVLREGCEGCDDCRETNECSACFADCDACDAQCASECVETAAFVVPELDAGPTVIELFNTHGGSERIAFEVLGASDTGADTGSADTGA